MTTVLITALLLAGTVYAVVSVLAEGLICPSILYVIVICVVYIPANKNGCSDSAAVAALAVAASV